MRILVDYQIFLSQRFGGISHYHARIHEAINRMPTGQQSFVSVLGSRNEYLGVSDPLRVLNGRNVLRRLNKSLTMARMSSFDVLHPTYYDNYFLSARRLPPYVLTVHDVIAERRFMDAPGRKMASDKKNLIARASRIIAISEATKKGILEFYDVPESSISVIYHGRPDYVSGVPAVPVAPFLLFVGQRWGYKNFSGMLAQAAPFMKRHDVRLKVVGKEPSAEERQEVAALGIGGLTDWVVGASDETLYGLYRQAMAFVFPSLEEGFGIPLLEASAAGCPVVCSDIPVFREVMGEAAVFFEPSSGLESALERVADARLIEAATANLSRFSWDDAARQTLEVYQSTL